MKKLLLLIALSLGVNNAFSADLCKAIALRDIAPIGHTDSILRRGEYVEAISQYRVDKRTAVATLCQHGGYCYPTDVMINGKKVEALKLTNCKVGKRDDYEDEYEIFYSVDVVRSKNTPQDLREDDLENKLLEMGVSNLPAAIFSEFYVRNPKSPINRVIDQATAGNQNAINFLQSIDFDPSNPESIKKIEKLLATSANKQRRARSSNTGAYQQRRASSSSTCDFSQEDCVTIQSLLYAKEQLNRSPKMQCMILASQIDSRMNLISSLRGASAYAAHIQIEKISNEIFQTAESMGCP